MFTCVPGIFGEGYSINNGTVYKVTVEGSRVYLVRLLIMIPSGMACGYCTLNTAVLAVLEPQSPFY